MDSHELERRLRAIEARLTALEGEPDAASARPATRASARREDVWWVLDGLQRRLDAGQGGVVYAGRFVDAGGGELQWQIGRPQQDLLQEDWSELSPRLSALGHPVRLRLLQCLLQGQGAVAELAAQPGLGSTGQLYHHLRELEAAGWLHAPQRGSYAVKPERVIPLLAMLAAARQ